MQTHLRHGISTHLSSPGALLIAATSHVVIVIVAVVVAYDGLLVDEHSMLMLAGRFFWIKLLSLIKLLLQVLSLNFDQARAHKLHCQFFSLCAARNEASSELVGF